MVASPRDCVFCIVFGTLHRAATNCFDPRWKRPVNLSPVSDAMDLHGAPLQENRRANPSNTPCLRRVSGDVRLMDPDAKKIGHERAADRRTVWATLLPIGNLPMAPVSIRLSSNPTLVTGVTAGKASHAPGLQ